MREQNDCFHVELSWTGEFRLRYEWTYAYYASLSYAHTGMSLKVKHYAFIIIKSYDLVLWFFVLVNIIIITLRGKNWLIFCVLLLFLGVMLVVWNFHIVEVPLTYIISFLIDSQGFSIHDIWHKIISCQDKMLVSSWQEYYCWGFGFELIGQFVSNSELVW